MKFLSSFAFVGFAATVLVACADAKGNPNAPTSPTSPTSPVPPASVSVRAVVVTGTPASGTGGATTYQMTAKADMSDGTSPDVTMLARWDTSDPSLAAISASGLLTALKSGRVDVHATYQNITGTLTLTTLAGPPQSATLALSGIASETPPAVKPLGGVTLRMIAGPNTGQSTTTDAQGQFLFPPLQPGEVGVEAVKDGYLLWRLTNLMFDHDFDLTVVLYPAPPTDGTGATATARCNDGSWSWAQTRAAACTADGGIAYTVCPGPMCDMTTTASAATSVTRRRR